MRARDECACVVAVYDVLSNSEKKDGEREDDRLTRACDERVKGCLGRRRPSMETDGDGTGQTSLTDRQEGTHHTPRRHGMEGTKATRRGRGPDDQPPNPNHSFPSLPISSVLLRSNSVAASNLRPHQPTLPSAAASPPAPRIEEEEPTSFPRQPRQAQGLPHRQPHLGFSVLPDCPPWGASARGGSRRSHRRRRRRSPAPTARAAAGTGRGTSTPASSPSRRPSRHRPTR